MCEKNENELQKVERAEIQLSTEASPMLRLAEMMQNGLDIDVDKMAKLQEMGERYEANEARKAYHVAMAAFKKEPPEITKDKLVSYKEVKYTHASLANVTNTINIALSEHGLSASWIQDQTDKGIKITCRITHELGHYEETSLTAPPDGTGSKNAIQAIGSTVTYLQRYTLLSLTGLATADQDDDGAGADNKPTEIPKPTEKEQAFIDAVIKLLPPVDGKVYNVERLGKYLYALNNNCYCYNMKTVDTAAEAVVQKGTPELYMDDAKGSQFEQDYNIDPDEDSQ